MATATGTPPIGVPVKRTSTDPTPAPVCATCPPIDPLCPDCTITPISNPSIKITKDGTLVDSNGNGIAEVGEKIIYTFVVKNTGNVTLTNVTVTDPLVAVIGGPITLAVGASNATTFTASYTLTASDITKAAVYNLATATGTPPTGVPVKGTSTDPTPAPVCATCPPIDPLCPDCTITPIFSPSIKITKDGILVDNRWQWYSGSRGKNHLYICSEKYRKCDLNECYGD